MSIILVGNGRSLYEHNLGNIIDTYDIVVRFNNFIIKGFEDCVGSKTTWWARNEVDEEFHRKEKIEKIILRLKGESAQSYEDGINEVLPSVQKNYPKIPIEVIPKDIFDYLITKFGFEKSPLTGTVVCEHLLRTYDRLVVTGFDNLKGAWDAPRHYYSDENLHAGAIDWHEKEKETQYLNELVEQGRVKIL